MGDTLHTSLPLFKNFAFCSVALLELCFCTMKKRLIQHCIDMDPTLTYNTTATTVSNSLFCCTLKIQRNSRVKDTGTNLSAGTCLAGQKGIKRVSSLSMMFSSPAHGGFPLSVFMAVEKVGRRLGVI